MVVFTDDRPVERPEMRFCRSCNAPIWWRRTIGGKLQPMDWDRESDSPTNFPHHASCPDARLWSNR